MNEGRRNHWMRIHLLIALVLTTALAGCATSEPNYLPADTGIDPFGPTRERAESYFESGLAHERQGEWHAALKDYRQARLWDPDNRQDIQDALTRAQTRADSQAAPSPTAPVTEDDGSTAGMDVFTSTSFPYSIAYPSDWEATQGETDEYPIDTIAGQPSPTVAALVMITVEPVASDTTLETLVTATSQQLETTGVNDVRIADRRAVGGQPAVILSYHIATSSGNASARHVIFLTPDNAWHIILLAMPATTPDLLEIFDTMLDSLELQSSAFPVA